MEGNECICEQIVGRATQKGTVPSDSVMCVHVCAGVCEGLRGTLDLLLPYFFYTAL